MEVLKSWVEDTYLPFIINKLRRIMEMEKEREREGVQRGVLELELDRGGGRLN